jgi:GNAT superfamily N-acetyltransferase
MSKQLSRERLVVQRFAPRVADIAAYEKLPASLQTALCEEEDWIFRSHMQWWFLWDKFHRDWWAYGGASEFSEGILYIGPTLVRPNCRGLGLQVYLIKQRLSWAKKNDYSVVRTSTYSDNIYSNNNLIKTGFRLVKPWNPAERHSLYWEKWL